MDLGQEPREVEALLLGFLMAVQQPCLAWHQVQELSIHWIQRRVRQREGKKDVEHISPSKPPRGWRAEHRLCQDPFGPSLKPDL